MNVLWKPWRSQRQLSVDLGVHWQWHSAGGHRVWPTSSNISSGASGPIDKFGSSKCQTRHPGRERQDFLFTLVVSYSSGPTAVDKMEGWGCCCPVFRPLQLLSSLLTDQISNSVYFWDLELGDNFSLCASQTLSSKLLMPLRGRDTQTETTEAEVSATDTSSLIAEDPFFPFMSI